MPNTPKRPDVAAIKARLDCPVRPREDQGLGAHARQDIPALIAYIEALEARQVKLGTAAKRAHRWFNLSAKQIDPGIGEAADVLDELAEALGMKEALAELDGGGDG